jgi:hypothetical protein
MRGAQLTIGPTGKQALAALCQYGLAHGNFHRDARHLAEVLLRFAGEPAVDQATALSNVTSARIDLERLSKMTEEPTP